jgi:hypothetical protein
MNPDEEAILANATGFHNMTIMPQMQTHTEYFPASDEDAKDVFEFGQITEHVRQEDMIYAVKQCGIQAFVSQDRRMHGSVTLFRDTNSFRTLHLLKKVEIATTYTDCGPRSIDKIVEKAWDDIGRLELLLDHGWIASVQEVTIWLPKFVTKKILNVVTHIIDLAAPGAIIVVASDAFPDLPAFGYKEARLDFVASTSVGAILPETLTYGPYGADVMVLCKLPHLRSKHDPTGYDKNGKFNTTATPRRWSKWRLPVEEQEEPKKKRMATIVKPDMTRKHIRRHPEKKQVAGKPYERSPEPILQNPPTLEVPPLKLSDLAKNNVEPTPIEEKAPLFARKHRPKEQVDIEQAQAAASKAPKKDEPHEETPATTRREPDVLIFDLELEKVVSCSKEHVQDLLDAPAPPVSPIAT